MAEDQLRFEERMGDADALAWSVEKDPMLRSTITVVIIMDWPWTGAWSPTASSAAAGWCPVCASGWCRARGPGPAPVGGRSLLRHGLPPALDRAAGTEDVSEVLRVAEPAIRN